MTTSPTSLTGCIASRMPVLPSPRVARRLAVAMLAVGQSLWAQQVEVKEPDQLPAFEAASVKTSLMPELLVAPKIKVDPGRYRATNVTLRQLVKDAYRLRVDALLAGGPSWIESRRFSIDAVGVSATHDRLRLMLQRLLIERFQLRPRVERRTLPVYKLVVARADRRLGKGLTPAAEGECLSRPGAEPVIGCGEAATAVNTLMTRATTLEYFAAVIAGLPERTDIDRYVIDETGLPGRYNIYVEFMTSRPSYGLRWVPRDDLGSFREAIQDQLGLKLVPAHAPVNVLVIESAAMPDSD